MKDIADPLARQAIAAIDSGNTAELSGLIAEYPWLVRERLQNQEKGYFRTLTCSGL